MTSTYTVPDNPADPADPEAAALELIVRLPGRVLQSQQFPQLLTVVLQDYCGVLHVEGVFAGLALADAKSIAASVRRRVSA